MKKIFLSLLFIFSIFGDIFGQTAQKTSPPGNASGSTGKKAEAPEIIGLTGRKAPNFTVAPMDGTEYGLEALRGKVVVLNLWATFCPPCIEEMPSLNALTEKYKGKDVVFLAAAADGKATLESFLPKVSFKYQILPDAFGIIEKYAPKKKVIPPNDNPGDFLMLLPAHLVIDQQGMIVEHFWGYKKTATDDLSQVIEKLLAKKS